MGDVWELALLVLGILGLWVGTEVVVESAVGLCRRFGLSEGFVGLTILAVGTDLPELVVGVSGGLMQLRGVETSGVVVGNATGSAIAQGSLVLGAAGLLGGLHLARHMVWRDGLTLLFAGALLTTLAADGAVTRAEGLALLLAYGAYYAWLIQAEREGRHARKKKGSWGGRRALFAVASGLVVVGVSAHVVVETGVELAARWGVNPTLIGLFLIAMGTSLPELALSVGAAARGRTALSVGNVIGSNTFDLMVPVGASAVIHPVAVGRDSLLLDLPFLAIATLAALVFLLWRRGLQRAEATTLIVLYAVYAVTRIGLEALHRGPGAAG